MSAYKSDFLNVLASRGFIHQVSEPEALDALARSSTITAYIGFDCTAASLHIGSLLPIMLLHWLQQTGHRPIALMGGGTTRVGDPSGKDESRRLLTQAAIEENLKGIRAIFSRFLRFGDGDSAAANDAVMADRLPALSTIFAALTTMTWSPVSMWGAKIGRCLPRRMRATSVATRPRTKSSASTTNQTRSISLGFVE